MVKRNKVAYSSLPSAMSAAIPEATFLTACEDAEARTVIAWYVDARFTSQREIEFSPRLGRLLSRAEREAQFPAVREITLDDDGTKVQIGNRLTPDTDVRYETYVAFDPVTSARLAESEQLFYAPVLLDPAAIIRPAIRKAGFPAVYAGWSSAERVRYWVGTLHRSRRETGETGRDEDEAFNPALLAHMHAIDPDIDGILKNVLAELARMERVAHDAIRATFNQRTGASI